MTAVIYLDQGREFENNMMQELCFLGGSHKTRTTPYDLTSDGLVERFNRTLLMMLAMFAVEHLDDWEYLLPAVMMVYHLSIHKSTKFNPYHLMFGQECPLPMDVGLPRRMHDMPDPINNPCSLWVREALEVDYDQVRCHMGQAVRRQKRFFDKRAVKRVFAVGDWTLRYYPPAKKCKLDSPWLRLYLVVSLAGWAVGVQLHPDSSVLLIHCQNLKKIPHTQKVWCPGSPPTIRLRWLHVRSWVRCVALRSDPPPPQCLTADVGSLSSGVDLALLPRMSIRIADMHIIMLYPFFHHRFDVGPLHLTSIAHAFNYRIAVPDVAASSVNFHDIVLEDLRATPESRAQRIMPGDVTSLRSRWPSALFATMRKRQSDMEGLRRTCRQRSEKAYTNGRPGICPQCGKFSIGAPDRHMMNNHLELGQLRKCPVEWCAVWKSSVGECLDHLRSKRDGAQLFAVKSLGKIPPPPPRGLFPVISGMQRFGGMYPEWWSM